jgi:hypothetical protein
MPGRLFHYSRHAVWRAIIFAPSTCLPSPARTLPERASATPGYGFWTADFQNSANHEVFSRKQKIVIIPRNAGPQEQSNKYLYLLKNKNPVFFGKFIDLVGIEHFSLFLAHLMRFQKPRGS